LIALLTCKKEDMIGRESLGKEGHNSESRQAILKERGEDGIESGGTMTIMELKESFRKRFKTKVGRRTECWASWESNGKARTGSAKKSGKCSKKK